MEGLTRAIQAVNQWGGGVAVFLLFWPLFALVLAVALAVWLADRVWSILTGAVDLWRLTDIWTRWEDDECGGGHW